MQWYPVSVWELLFEVSLPVCICNIYTLPPFWKNNKNSVGRWSFPSDSWCHQKTINAQRNKGGHFTRQLSIKSNLNLFWKMSGGCLQSSACRCILRICWAHIFSHLCLVNFMKPWWDTTFFFFFFFLFWLKWEVFDLCHWRQWLSFHWAQWEHVSACKDLQSMFLVEVVQIVLIQLNFNKVYQLYYLDLTECEKPLQVSQPPSSSSLPVFLPSWKAQTFFQIYLFGTVHPLNFPAPRTLRSVALQDPWRIFLLPAWGRDWRAPKSHQSV